MFTARTTTTMMVRRAAIALTACFTIAPAAAHAAFWSPAARVSDSGEQAYLGPRVATDANGDMIVAWVKVSSVAGGAWHCPCLVRAAYKPAGGSFGAPANVSPSMPDDDSAQQVFLAMAASGDAVVGWNGGPDQANPGDYDMPYAAIRPAGATSSFGQPVQLATPVGRDTFGVGLDGLQMDAAGDALAIVDNAQAYTGAGGVAGDQVVDTQVVRRPAGGQFDTAHPQVLGDGTHNAFARALAMSPSGRAVIAMRIDGVVEADPPPTVSSSVAVSTSSGSGAAFTTPSTIESLDGHPQVNGVYPEIDTGSVVTQNIAIDDAGDYVVGYTRSDAVSGDPNQADNTVKVSFDGGAGMTLSQPAQTFSANGPVVIDLSGEAVMLWSDGNGNEMESVRTPGQGFGPSVATGLPLAMSMTNALNETGTNGQIVYAYGAAGASQSDVDASIGTVAGTFPAATTLASGDDFFGFGVSTAIDKGGDAAATWLGGTTNQYEVHVAVYSNGSSPASGTNTLTVNKTGSGTVSSSPAGIDCGSACSHAFAIGTKVTLTANPASGSKFTGWSGGGCSGTGTCAVTLSGDQAVHAAFASNPGGGTSPNTKLAGKKIDRKHHKATFKFRAVGSATHFQCALIKRKKGRKQPKAKFSACKSPKTYARLKKGSYVFQVRAIGATGPDKTPASTTFRM